MYGLHKPRFRKGNVPTPVIVTARMSVAEGRALQRLADSSGATVSRTVRTLIAAACEKRRLEADA
jgi:hypothetical protein